MTAAARDLFSPPPRAVLADVGFTLVFIDGTTVAALAAHAGVAVDPASIHRSEEAIRAELASHRWPSRPAAGALRGAAGGVGFFRRLLELAGAAGDLDAAAAHCWDRHLVHNVWRRPGPSTGDALLALRRAGIAVAAVSNSEGTIDALLTDLGWRSSFAVVADSWVVGAAKPDPAIFAWTLSRLGLAAEDAIMIGDSPAADVAGARSAGIRAALVDPLDLHLDSDAPRFDTFAAFVAALTENR